MSKRFKARADLAWDSGYMGRFTLGTFAKPNLTAFPYSRLPDNNDTQLTVSQRIAVLTRPNETSFPYALKPRGWSRATDPFQAEAKRRLAEERAA